MRGYAPAELINPYELPDLLLDPWNWFLEVRQSVQHGMGPGTISEADMAAYFALRGIRPGRWALETIRILERIALEHK